MLNLSATSPCQAGGNLLSPAAMAESINSQLKTGRWGLPWPPVRVVLFGWGNKYVNGSGVVSFSELIGRDINNTHATNTRPSSSMLTSQVSHLAPRPIVVREARRSCYLILKGCEIYPCVSLTVNIMICGWRVMSLTYMEHRIIILIMDVKQHISCPSALFPRAPAKQQIQSHRTPAVFSTAALKLFKSSKRDKQDTASSRDVGSISDNTKEMWTQQTTESTSLAPADEIANIEEAGTAAWLCIFLCCYGV